MQNLWQGYNYNKYQYETSPRKLEPEYAPKKKTKGKKKKNRKKKSKSKKKLQQEKAKIQTKIHMLLLGFAILFGNNL